jgi:hypothetical protein
MTRRAATAGAPRGLNKGLTRSSRVGYGGQVRQASLLAVALVVVVAAGCGGGDKRLSRQQYASKADSVCTRYNRQIRAVQRPSSLPDLGRSIDKLLPSFERALADLRRLKPPESEQATATRWLAQVDRLEGDLKAVRDQAKRNDLQGVQAAGQRGARDNDRGNALAAKLGMTVCSKG